ncbi:MAG: HlyD family secretion protein [Bacteroidales bacterium]
MSLFSCKNDKNQPDAYGNFEVDEVIVSAQSNGQIFQLNLNEGSVIKKGTVVGCIDSSQLVWKKRQLISGIESIKAQLPDIGVQIAVLNARLENAYINQKRIKELQNSDAATIQQLDNINNEVLVLQREKESLYTQLNTQTRALLAQIEPIQMQIAGVNDEINKCLIKVPIDGTVLTKVAQEGEMAGFASPLWVMANIDSLNIRVYISEPQLSNVRLGQKAKVTIDAPGGKAKSFEGNIIWISSQSEFTPKTVQTKDERVNLVYALKVRLKNDGSLKIGMPGQVYFLD